MLAFLCLLLLLCIVGGKPTVQTRLRDVARQNTRTHHKKNYALRFFPVASKIFYQKDKNILNNACIY